MKFKKNDFPMLDQTAVEQLASIVIGSDDAIISKNLDGKITTWNRGAEKIFGYSADEIIGKNVEILIPPDRLQDESLIFKQILLGHRVSHFDAMRLCKDGKKIAVSITVSPIFDSNGNVIGASKIARDITAQQHSAEELLLANKKLLLQGNEKAKRAAELVLANEELAFQNSEKDKRSEELVLANQEKADRAAELVIANAELAFQNQEKDKRVAELVIANEEKASRASELQIANAKLAFQNSEKDKRSAELVIANEEKVRLKSVNNEKLQVSLMETIAIARQLVELRDPYTAGHEKHVGDLAKAIAVEMGFDEMRQEGLMIAGYLHDIGKIIVPVEILCKPGKISPEEYNLIKNHVQAGYDLLKDVSFPWDIARAVLEHHERLDGSGYPNALEGSQISIEGRILGVVDVVEAMSSYRPYRPALGMSAALAEIERGRGVLYDVEVVDICLRLFREKAYVISPSLSISH